MKDKFSRLGIDLSKGSFGLIDSFDGCEHKNSEEGITSITSFSSTLFSHKTFMVGYSTNQTSNILTWQQFLGKEKDINVISSLKEHYQDRLELQKSLIAGGNKVNFYDLHDGKILYILTQHSLFTRKHHPYLLCSCGRGDGVVTPNHQ